jgi:acyl-CoA synthetase (AMP-forming)/AMP-acid ligase II
MIFPDEVEAVLRYHPTVADAAVVGLPHLTLGHYLVALVAAEPNQQSPSTEEIRQFCVGRLSGYKVPREVLTVEAIRRVDKRVDQDWARTTAAELLGLSDVP